MTTIPVVDTPVRFNLEMLPSGIRRNLGGVRDGIVTAVTWNGRIGVKPTGSTGIVWVEAMDVTEAQPQ